MSINGYSVGENADSMLGDSAQQQSQILPIVTRHTRLVWTSARIVPLRQRGAAGQASEHEFAYRLDCLSPFGQRDTTLLERQRVARSKILVFRGRDGPLGIEKFFLDDR